MGPYFSPFFPILLIAGPCTISMFMRKTADANGLL